MGTLKNQERKDGENIKEYDRCLRCGRKLKKPEHRLLGYGPVCFKKSQKSRKIHLF